MGIAVEQQREQDLPDEAIAPGQQDFVFFKRGTDVDQQLRSAVPRRMNQKGNVYGRKTTGTRRNVRYRNGQRSAVSRSRRKPVRGGPPERPGSLTVGVI